KNSRQFSKCMEGQRYATSARMRERLALSAVACLDFWPGEVVERRIHLTWLASRDPWFMLRTIPGTVRGVGGSVVPSSLPANPVDHVIAPRRQFEILFATLLPKDVQVEVEMPDGRRFLMPRRRLQGRPALLAGLNAPEAGDLLAREAPELGTSEAPVPSCVPQGGAARAARRPAPKRASGSAIATDRCRERSLPSRGSPRHPEGRNHAMRTPRREACRGTMGRSPWLTP